MKPCGTGRPSSPRRWPKICDGVGAAKQAAVSHRDETYITYIKVDARWCYLYRAIDRSGVLVDVMFSEHCNGSVKNLGRYAAS